MKVVGNFEHNRNLSGKGAGAANILLRNARVVEAVQYAEHAEHFPVAPNRGTVNNCSASILRENLLVRAGQLAEIIRPENFFFAQGAGGDALGKNVIDAARLAASDGVANPKLSVFEQRDEASAISRGNRRRAPRKLAGNDRDRRWS